MGDLEAGPCIAWQIDADHPHACSFQLTAEVSKVVNAARATVLPTWDKSERYFMVDDTRILALIRMGPLYLLMFFLVGWLFALGSLTETERRGQGKRVLDSAWTYNCNNIAEPSVSRRHNADAPSAAQLQKLLRVVGRQRQCSAIERQPAHRTTWGCKPAMRGGAASLPCAEAGAASLPCAEHLSALDHGLGALPEEAFTA